MWSARSPLHSLAAPGETAVARPPSALKRPGCCDLSRDTAGWVSWESRTQASLPSPGLPLFLRRGRHLLPWRSRGVNCVPWVPGKMFTFNFSFGGEAPITMMKSLNFSYFPKGNHFYFLKRSSVPLSSPPSTMTN